MAVYVQSYQSLQGKMFAIAAPYKKADNYSGE
jgi:hypothetical protein